MTRERGEKIPAFRANRDVEGHDAVLARAELLSPYTGWRWYIAEWEAAMVTCFGLVQGHEEEPGRFDLTELSELTVFGGVPAVRRDLHWKPRTLGEIKRLSGLVA